MRRESRKEANLYRTIGVPRVDSAACNFTPKSRKLWQMGLAIQGHKRDRPPRRDGPIAPGYFLRGPRSHEKQTVRARWSLIKLAPHPGPGSVPFRFESISGAP